MSNCCPPTRCPGLVPATEYVAKGEYMSVKNEKTGKDLRVYKVGSSASKLAVVMIMDIFGMDTGRHIGLCDEWAERLGCLVVCPDILHGDAATFAMAKEGKLMEVIMRHPAPELQQELDCVYEKVIPKFMIDSFMLVGFCWGSWLAFEEGARLVDERLKGAVNFHPSLGLVARFGGDVEELGKKNKIPMLVCPCKDDPDNVKPGGVLPVELCEFHVFTEENHGFMTQGDPAVEHIAKDIEVGINLSTSFFRRHLKISCCPSTRCPALVPPADYTPKGEFVVIKNDHNGKDLRVYKVGKASSRKALVMIHDIFGIDSGRHIGLCDDWAESLGCIVVCPDLFRGDFATFEMFADGTGMEVIGRHKPSDVEPDLRCVYEKVIPSEDFESFALVGFCWGCWVVFEESGRNADSRLKCGVNFHPSLKLATVFGGSFEQLAESNDISMLMLPCKDDPMEVMPEGAFIGPKYQFHVFSEEQHGFMSQADPSHEQAAKDIKTGLKLLTDFVKSHL